MSDRVSNSRRPRAQKSPYVPPGARGGRRAESIAATPPSGANTSLVFKGEDGGARHAGGATENRGISSGGFKKETKKSTDDRFRLKSAGGEARATIAVALVETKATRLAKASEGQLNGSVPSTREEGVKGQDSAREEVIPSLESNSRSCLQLSPKAIEDDEAADRDLTQPRSTEHRRDLGSQQSRRKPRREWSPYEPPGRRVGSYSYSSPPRNGEESAGRLDAELAAASLLPANVANETRAPAEPTARVPATGQHTTQVSVARAEKLHGPTAPEEPSCSQERAGPERREPADIGMAVVIRSGGEEVEIDNVLTATATQTVEIPPSSHPETATNISTYPTEAQQNKAPATGNAVLGANQTLCVSPTGCSSSLERSLRISQEDNAVEDREILAGPLGESTREGGIGSGNDHGVLWGVRASMAQAGEDRPRSLHIDEAPPEQLYVEEEEKGSSTCDVNASAGGGGSPVTELDTTRKPIVEGTIKVESSARNSDCDPTDPTNAGEKINGAKSKGNPTAEAVAERYIPPGRRKVMDAATMNADGAEEWKGPLWSSRAPIRVRQKERPSDGQTSPTRPAPARVAGVVCGGMSAYGASISEYSEEMSRGQVEMCTALITNFPSALPPGQRELMLQAFFTLGALITWARHDEALATFATPALARQAISAKSNHSSVLKVELLSSLSIEKRKGYHRIELSRPGRPPADVSSASRLISGALGLRRSRAQLLGSTTVAGTVNSGRRSKSGARGKERGARSAPVTECTDSWDM